MTLAASPLTESAPTAGSIKKSSTSIEPIVLR